MNFNKALQVILIINYVKVLYIDRAFPHRVHRLHLVEMGHRHSFLHGPQDQEDLEGKLGPSEGSIEIVSSSRINYNSSTHHYQVAGLRNPRLDTHRSLAHLYLQLSDLLQHGCHRKSNESDNLEDSTAS